MDYLKPEIILHSIVYEMFTVNYGWKESGENRIRQKLNCVNVPNVIVGVCINLTMLLHTNIRTNTCCCLLLVRNYQCVQFRLVKYESHLEQMCNVCVPMTTDTL